MPRALSQPPTDTGLRAQQKAQRLDRILAAAEKLIDRHGESVVTAEAIAEEAGVSTPTVYNLAGTREELLTALMVRAMDRFRTDVEALETGTPLERGAQAVRICAGLFTARPRLYRDIILRLGGAAGVAAPYPDATPDTVQINLMQEAARDGMLVRGTSPLVLGRQIFMSFVGAMAMWAGGRINDDAFLAQALHGYFAATAACAIEPHRSRLEKLMRREARWLAQAIDPA
ncbi:TetR family transcriptional regulator [Pyruvatibacter mobilis]|uniref:TetR family transcriptional regulator n=1 Tax=Pyruvatibacter mobilis TaxID=1712261 RepID=A0A845QEL7_9HYPH|nr:TetR/AcrR family transcriptional regulator [Pyruvatibacter mobilis]NBG96640.1 TetR family transcriptional regulator [Pyruvatibacter mobilis]QJD74355.1 TetR/AcrR family transcriptional regulator [Pyruvatibacter mobilis]GGD06249.1 hypothetical protein GCM10011587_07720 [Pyruvatibacter mobilis]